MSDIEFVKGINVKERREGAPEFLVASFSIKREQLIEWLEGKDDEWINVDIKTAKSGKPYCAVNGWKPSETRQERSPSRTSAPSNDGFEDDSDLPF